METEKQQSMLKTYREFMRIGLDNDDPELLREIFDEGIFGFGTAMDEKVLGFEGFKKLLETQFKQSNGLEIKWSLEPVAQLVTPDENTVVFADDVFLSINTGGDTVQMYLRFSVVLNYNNRQWKIIHWHGSKPEPVESEKDTWGIETWKQKAEELERLVVEKTTDLLEKKRELEIEAAVERVRAEAMAMHSTEDFGKVARQLLQQIRNLSLKGFTGASIYLIDENEFITCYDFSSFGNMGDAKNQFMRYDANKFPQLGRYPLSQWKKGESYFELDFDFEKLQAGAKEFEKININVANSLKEALAGGHLTHQWDACGRLSNGFIAFDMTNPPNEDVRKITIKMTYAFEQAYARFLDLQKAEAQALHQHIGII